MKDYFKLFGYIALAAIVIYFINLLFVPMIIGQKIVDRKVTEQSLQYIRTQREGLVKLYDGYSSADSDARKSAIRGQMCEIMSNIPTSEVPNYIKGEIVCR